MSTTTDVPDVVTYGQIVGHFVSFLADSADAGNVPDERTLSGKAILQPLVTFTQWPTATPPRMAVVERLECPIVNGDLCAPGSTTPGVFVVATAQPAGQPSTIQWQASLVFDGVATQPAPVIFDVPAGGVVDLSVVVPTTPQPPIVVVVSHEDRVAAEQAAADAAASAADAATAGADAGAAAGADAGATAGASAGATAGTTAGTTAGQSAGASAGATAGHDAATAVIASAPKWWQGTQAQFDALPAKDATTLYLVTP